MFFLSTCVLLDGLYPCYCAQSSRSDFAPLLYITSWADYHINVVGGSKVEPKMEQVGEGEGMSEWRNRMCCEACTLQTRSFSTKQTCCLPTWSVRYFGWFSLKVLHYNHFLLFILLPRLQCSNVKKEYLDLFRLFVCHWKQKSCISLGASCWKWCFVRPSMCFNRGKYKAVVRSSEKAGLATGGEYLVWM